MPTSYKAALSESHLTFRLLPEIKELSRSFLDQNDLDHFYYAIYHPRENKAIILTTIPRFNRHVLAQYGFLKEQELEVGVHYLPNFKAGSTRAEEGKRFDIDQAIELVEHPKAGHIEIFGFASKCHKSEKVNFYLNHLEALYQFSTEFKNRAQSLIKDYTQDPIILSKDTHSNIQAQPFLQPTSIHYHQKHITLNRRELQVLKFLYQGCTAKETAHLLNLSPRTVEAYLENIKNKTGLSRKVDLLKLIIDTHLMTSMREAS